MSTRQSTGVFRRIRDLLFLPRRRRVVEYPATMFTTETVQIGGRITVTNTIGGRVSVGPTIGGRVKVGA